MHHGSGVRATTPTLSTLVPCVYGSLDPWPRSPPSAFPACVIPAAGKGVGCIIHPRVDALSACRARPIHTAMGVIWAVVLNRPICDIRRFDTARGSVAVLCLRYAWDRMLRECGYAQIGSHLADLIHARAETPASMRVHFIIYYSFFLSAHVKYEWMN